ncbi:MAG: hypothetical protein LUI01_04305 [Firmicutes bacterium]|nr:hypothetical protein [Bacillota bacterium]
MEKRWCENETVFLLVIMRTWVEIMGSESLGLANAIVYTFIALAGGNFFEVLLIIDVPCAIIRFIIICEMIKIKIYDFFSKRIVN